MFFLDWLCLPQSHRHVDLDAFYKPSDGLQGLLEVVQGGIQGVGGAGCRACFLLVVFVEVVGSPFFLFFVVVVEVVPFSSSPGVSNLCKLDL